MRSVDDLAAMYSQHNRLWPVIVETALELLPRPRTDKRNAGGGLWTATSAWPGEAISRIAQESFWSNEELLASISGSLPNYRLTKFQPLMPDWVEREILQNHLLDMPGVNMVLPTATRMCQRQ